MPIPGPVGLALSDVVERGISVEGALHVAQPVTPEALVGRGGRRIIHRRSCPSADRRAPPLTLPADASIACA